MPRAAGISGSADPSITLVASGAFPASLTIHSEPFYIDPDTRKIVQRTPVIVEYGSETDWNYRLMKDAWGNFDIISEHTYGDPRRYDLTLGERVDVTESVLSRGTRGLGTVQEGLPAGAGQHQGEHRRMGFLRQVPTRRA